MAETLGAIASGFAVVSLAIQVAETIRKLKSFHSLMQSAPEDILFAIEEIEVLSLILEDVDRSVQDQVFLDPKVKIGVMRSWRMCKTATSGLVTLLNKLEEGLGGSKGKGKLRGKVRIAMKKVEIDDFRKKIESAKTTMQLANQIYYQAIQSQRWNSLEQHYSIIEREMVQIHSVVRSSPGLGGQCPQKMLGNAETIEVEARREDEDVVELPEQKDSPSHRATRHPARPKTQASMHYLSGLISMTFAADEHNATTSISFSLPRWVYARRFELRWMKSRQGWDQSFRSCRMVSYDAKIFDFCMDGDIAGLQHLFATGQASPFEIDPDGRTPLHYAALYARPEVCEFMIKHGADVNARTYWHGELNQFPWESSACSIGLYPYKNDIPTGESFRGWTAYSTPLHLLLCTGHVLTSDGRQAFNRETYKPGRGTAIAQDFERTVEFLMEFGADTVLEDQYSRTAFHIYTGPNSSFSRLVRESTWDLKTMLQEDYVGTIMSQGLNFTANGLDICRQLVTEDALQAHTRISSTGFFLLHILVFSYFCRIELTETRSRSLISLENLIVEVIQTGADLHSISDEGRTPLLSLLEVILGYRPKTYVLQKWLELLDRVGVNLVEYGRKENEMRDDYEINWTFWIDIGRQYEYENMCCFKLLDLWIGETPDDFHFEFEDLYASTPLAAEFWDWVEANLDEEKFKAIPGSWKDD
ncbi:hypothetical protein BKA64DRAFT_641243 [Cadophora sp. MPI-SDFR-AT-0126]|nr:hypothetical protein BKA64DRAFT_641243 [Leotiomycetes sp. MPI-SDFR-AT-0126]